MNLVSLFPTPVGIFKFDRSLTEEEQTFITSQEKIKNLGNTTSKNRKVLEDKTFAELFNFAKMSIDKYFEETVKPEFDVNLRITQSWLNYTEPGQYHHKHTHPNSIVSAVFYVNADPEVDKIYFYKDLYKQIKFKSKEYNIFNSESWWLPVASGDLLIFPSDLAHSVDIKSGNNVRVSLALNTFPIGYIGNDDELTGLHL